MGKIKGQAEFEKFQAGESLSRKQAILAQCFICNGEEQSAEDCKGVSCPLYQYHPHKGRKKVKEPKKAENPEQAEIMASAS